MKPLVGLNADLKPASAKREEHSLLYPRYYDAVWRAGGMPVVLPPLEPTDDMRDLVRRVDAIVLTGGADLDPAGLGLSPHPNVTVIDPRRERFDRALARAALDGGIPVLAICLGMQVLNVSAGGSLFVHMTDEVGDLQRHQRAKPDVALHPVRLVLGSQVHRVYGRDTIPVYSNHHQAVDRVGPGWRVTAESDDGVVEAIEPLDTGRFCIGVQWHPESPHCPDGDRLFEALVTSARQAC